MKDKGKAENAFADSQYTLPEEAHTPNLRTLAVSYVHGINTLHNLSLKSMTERSVWSGTDLRIMCMVLTFAAGRQAS
jgi:hypothetical protein